MKSFVLTLLILSALFLGYDCYLAPVGEKMVFKKPAAKTERADPSPTRVAAPPPTPSADVIAPPAEPRPVASMAPEPPPVPVVPAPAPVPESDGLPSVEEFTQNWTQFPPSAFPRPVKVTRDIRFVLGAGTALVKAGGEVVAIEWSSKGLVVAPTSESKARAIVSMDGTDFKTRMTAIYDAWKSRQIASAPRPTSPPPSVQTSTSEQVEKDGRPVVAADGTIPMLLAAMKSGRVSEVTPHNITRWGTPKLANINGQEFWAVEVDFTSSTQMGTFDAESVVHIREGRIQAWIFKGTGESVP
jgi:hypothetical protein